MGSGEVLNYRRVARHRTHLWTGGRYNQTTNLNLNLKQTYLRCFFAPSVRAPSHLKIHQ